MIESINMFCFYLHLVNLYQVHLMRFKQSIYLYYEIAMTDKPPLE